jgi:hypothetical protein
MKVLPHTMRRRAALVAGLLGAAAIAIPAGAMAADEPVVVNATINGSIALTACPDISFGAFNVGAPVASRDCLVTVTSNLAGGYNLSAAAGAWNPAASIPLAFSGAGLGTHTGITAQGGDPFTLQVLLGPIGMVPAGDYSATVTFTAASLP